MGEEESIFPILTDPAELLFRQVHPSQCKDGSPTKEAFRPSARDNNQLSTLRERVGAAEAYRRWTEDHGLQSVGTYGVSVGEVVNENLEAVDDEATTQPDHASIDFTKAETKGQQIRIARRLRDAAVRRGRQHDPESIDGIT